jgi:hypothetical protein
MLDFVHDQGKAIAPETSKLERTVLKQPRSVANANRTISYQLSRAMSSTVRPKPAYIDFRQALSSHARFTIATTTFANIFLGAPHVAFS